MHYLWIIWLFPVIKFTWMAYCLLRNSGRMVGSSLEYALTPGAHLIFRITTNGKAINCVNETVRFLNNTLRSFTGNFKIEILTDEGNWVDYEGGADMLICPDSFKCKAKNKARTMHFAASRMKERNSDLSSIWVLHLDDESIVTEQCLGSIIHHINSGGEGISEGWIIYPRKFSQGSLFSSLADCIRPVGCFECREILDRNLITHLHGSNLLIRADIESRIGWEFDSIAEDSVFGIKAIELGYKIGWHGGVLEEQPVFSIGDLFRQRRRWFHGQLVNIATLSMPFKLRILIALELFVWWLGFPSAVLSSVILVGSIFVPELMPHIPLAFRIFLIPGTWMWILSYQIGVLFNARMLQRSTRILLHISALGLLPVISLLEVFPVFAFSLAPRKFHTVRKEG